jgi:hypothetical protein
MLTKRAYVKPHIDMTGSDLKIDGLENTIRFWRDPSRQIVFTLLDTITMTAEKDIDTNFWEAVSEVIVDCDIEGLDFSTAEKARESFDNPHISWGVLFDALFGYVSWLLTENEKVGKALARPKNP